MTGTGERAESIDIYKVPLGALMARAQALRARVLFRTVSSQSQGCQLSVPDCNANGCKLKARKFRIRGRNDNREKDACYCMKDTAPQTIPNKQSKRHLRGCSTLYVNKRFTWW
jgi:hypothetical protein